jgi:hypothetical protein
LARFQGASKPLHFFAARFTCSFEKMHRFSAPAALAFVCFIATTASAFAPSRRVGTSVAFGTTTCNRHGRPFTTSALQLNFVERLNSWAYIYTLEFAVALSNYAKSKKAKSYMNKALRSLKNLEKIQNQSLKDLQV